MRCVLRVVPDLRNRRLVGLCDLCEPVTGASCVLLYPRHATELDLETMVTSAAARWKGRGELDEWGKTPDGWT